MSETPKPLADRISVPSSSAPAAADKSWADQVASPTEKKNTLEAAQVDGATETQGGSGLQESEYDVEVKLSELQANSDSPLYSAHTFEELGLSEHILKGIYSMDYKKPSKIQEKALPLLLSNPPTNMIAQSQSGTGKTAAFVITVLSRIDYNSPDKPQALILAPARELARQIEGVVQRLGTFVPGLTIQAAVPGSVERDTPVKAMVIVGTPGTVTDLIRRRQLDVGILKTICLDEADNMLDQQGLGDQCLRVKKMLPNLQQVLLFSATFPSTVNTYAAQFCPNAAEIRLKHNELTVGGIKQMYMDCNGEQGKYDTLVQLYHMMTIGSSIIFVKTRATASAIGDSLTKAGHTVVAIHGAFEGAERDNILERFRSGEAKVLITTNVLARGIDVQSVSMVINYDIPMKGRGDAMADPETYLHRIGRTGRFGRVGVSISFVFDRKSLKALTDIADFYAIDLVQLDQHNWDKTEEIIKKVIKSSRAGTNFKQ